MMGFGRRTVSSTWLALIWPALSVVALTFTNSNPTQCDPLTVNWQGGQPPFRLLMISPNNPMYNFTIPPSSFNNNAGSYTIPQLVLPKGQRVMFAMSDATGVSVGGLTSLLTVSDPVGNVPCNTTSPNPDFFYSLDNDLVECQPYTFSLYPNAVQPVTIFGFVPNGQLVTLFPPQGPEFDWITNVTAGTTMLFYMEDAQGRDGGISNIEVVQLSADASCLSSTGGSNSTATTPGSPPTSTGTGNGPSTSSKSSNVAVIAGAAAGGGAVVVLLGLLVGCCIWRRRRSSDSRLRLPMVRKGSSKEGVDLLDGVDGHNMPDVTLANYVVEPFVAGASSSTPSLTGTGTVVGTGMGTGSAPTHLSPLSRKEQMRLAIMNETSGASVSGHTNVGHTHSRIPSDVQLSEFGAGSEYLAAGGGSSRYSTAQTTTGASFGMSGSGYGPSFYASSRPSREGLLSPGVHSSSGDRSSNGQSTFSSGAQRVIVHTDIAEAQLMDDEQPLELPPMYSEARRPIPGLLSSDIPATTADATPRSRKGS